MRIGDAAPSFELTDTNGDTYSLGVPSPEVAATLVYWTCNHCPYALAWEERLHRVSRDNAGRGVRVLAINSNDETVTRRTRSRRCATSAERGRLAASLPP